MPVTVRAAALLAILGLFGCSGSGNGGSTGGSSGGTGDGGSDAGQSCFVLDAGCADQAACSSGDGVQVYACKSGRCELEAGRLAACAFDTPTESVQVTLSSSFGTLPHSLEVRAYYPFRVDGTAVGCSALLGSADFPDGGSALDADPTLNAQNIGAYPPSCTSSGCVYLLTTNLVRGSTPVILVQAYSGNRDTTGNHVTGIRLGEGCTEGTAVSTDNQTFDVTVSP